MTKKTDTPAIRFKGFSDTWEQRKLGEVLISLQNNTLSRADLSSEEGIAKNIHYGDILVKFGEVIDVKTESLPMIGDETVIAKYKSSFLQNGDVIVADTAEDETVGKCTEIAGLSDEIVISGLHTIPYRPLQKYAPGYLGYYMNSPSYHNQLLPLMQGIKVTSISKTALQNTDILYPKSATEQAAIGRYFRNLDNLITLHQREYEKLHNIKKSMLEKMFPKNGSNVPEIRFKGFTEAWEQRKLGEVLISLQNNTLSRADLSSEEGIAKNIHYGDILVKFGEVIDVKTESLPMIGDETVIAKYKSSFLQNGDVIVADTAEDETVGKCTEIAGLSDEIVISGLHTIPYRPLQKYAPGYLGYYMNSPSYHNQLLPLMQGIKVTSISKTALQNTDILYPKSATEQAAIGRYFRNLDNLITLHQREYEKLHNIKKSMLEKMFPKNGSNVPEIRFKGFTEAWEQRKFSELVQIERGGSPRPIDDFITDAPNGLNWVKIGDAPTQGNYITKTAEKIRPEGLSKTREVHPGDLILSNSMSFGKPYIMGIDGCIHDGWLLIRNTYGVFDLTFLCHLLGTPQMLSQYRSLAAGSTVNNLNKELVGNTYVTIPSITEQRVLGAYLEQLDSLITLHQREEIAKCSFLFFNLKSLKLSVSFINNMIDQSKQKFKSKYSKNL